MFDGWLRYACIVSISYVLILHNCNVGGIKSICTRLFNTTSMAFRCNILSRWNERLWMYGITYLFSLCAESANSTMLRTVLFILPHTCFNITIYYCFVFSTTLEFMRKTWAAICFFCVCVSVYVCLCSYREQKTTIATSYDATTCNHHIQARRRRCSHARISLAMDHRVCLHFHGEYAILLGSARSLVLGTTSMKRHGLRFLRSLWLHDVCAFIHVRVFLCCLWFS